ncbi:MAG: hypothetical protein JST14_04720, partial [Bacteroidetes bacterium]|nr:hypothetical protein [Bacteroidota bacterium]
IIRDKEYDLAQGNPNSRVHYLSANPNGEAEVVEVKLSQSSTARKKIFEFDFAEMEIKGRGARGNTITKYPVRRVDLLQAGTSTLSGLELWFEESSGRLNKDKRGKHVGKFDGDDQILAITRNGNYKITGYDLTTRFEPEKTILVEKFNPKKVITAVYKDGESKQHFVKRFKIETNSLDKEFGFISESIGSHLEFVTTSDSPEVEVDVVKGKGKTKETEVINLEDIIDVKGWKAMGNRLTPHKVVNVRPVTEPEDTGLETEESAEEKAAETERGSQSPKKKSETDQEEPKPQARSEKQSPVQQNLFGESEPRKEKPKESKAPVRQKAKEVKDKVFTAGQTIELEL